jgi:hypothetical protein
MNERDILYSAFRQADEQRKRRNFDAFMDGFEGGLIKNLDDTYKSGNQESYQRLLNNIKSKGIKVLRNSEGKHKLQFVN